MIDPECLALVQAMNTVPGIRTVESCCGHGQTAFRIWFKPDNLECLPDLLYWFSACHSGCAGWSVKVETDCARSPVSFFVEGPIGDQGFSDADEIAKLIKDDKETA